MRAQCESCGWWVGKQGTRAVASLVTRTRVVASLEVSNSRGREAPIYAGSSRAPGSELWPPGQQSNRLNHFPTTPGSDSARFAQLAIGCSNLTFNEDWTGRYDVFG